MDIFLWVLQGMLAFVFLMAAAMKLTKTKEELSEKMEWAVDVQPSTIKLIGFLELLGVIGIILPSALSIATILTPLAAVGLALTMIGAFYVHAKRGDKKEMMVNIVLFVMALVVAYFRFMA